MYRRVDRSDDRQIGPFRTIFLDTSLTPNSYRCAYEISSFLRLTLLVDALDKRYSPTLGTILIKRFVY